MPKNTIREELNRRVEEYFKNNAMGQVCECGGGGFDYDEKERCKKCNGSGIYKWEAQSVTFLYKLYNS